MRVLCMFLGLVLYRSSWLTATAQQLIANPTIDGTAADNPAADIHTRNFWFGVESESDVVGKWWTGVNGATGYCSTDGNPDGNMCGGAGVFLNRFQIIDNTETQAIGEYMFSVDRRWYDDDPTVGTKFVGVKWMLFGLNALSDMPSSIDLDSGSGFGIGDGTGTLLGEYNFNDINNGSLDGDGISDTGELGTMWDTQQTVVDLGSTAYDYLYLSIRAGAAGGDSSSVNVPPRFDNVTLSPVLPTGDADFDGDGDVDGVDFLIWQRGFEVGSTLAEGDADGNSVVNDADLTVWQNQFGQAAMSATVISVPEPNSPMLTSLLALSLLIKSRQRFR